MAGRKGRSGGHNRLPAQLHKIRGTWSATRHGSTQTATVSRPVVADAPPDALLVGLAADGAAFLRAVYAEYTPSEAEGLLLRLAAQSLDDATAARGGGDSQGQRAAVRQVLAILQRLGLPAGERA